MRRTLEKFLPCIRVTPDFLRRDADVAGLLERFDAGAHRRAAKFADRKRSGSLEKQQNGMLTSGSAGKFFQFLFVGHVADFSDLSCFCRVCLLTYCSREKRPHDLFEWSAVVVAHPLCKMDEVFGDERLRIDE